MRQNFARGAEELGQLLAGAVIGLAAPFLVFLMLISVP